MGIPPEAEHAAAVGRNGQEAELKTVCWREEMKTADVNQEEEGC